MMSIVNKSSNRYIYTKEYKAITPLIYKHTTNVKINNLKSVGYNQLHRITEEDNDYDLS